MRTVRAAADVALPPGAALAVWVDPERWPGFVEGFGRVVELREGWPAPGAGIVWDSRPGGRGRVRERVVEHDRTGGRFVTDVTEEPPGSGSPRLRGRQTLELLAGDAGPRSGIRGSRARLSLAYELVRGHGSPGAITDLLFVRRALRDALRRTLERFAAEAAREAAR